MDAFCLNVPIMFLGIDMHHPRNIHLVTLIHSRLKLYEVKLGYFKQRSTEGVF